MTEPSGERLQKVLARTGFGSRRSSEELISAGRVRINGEVASLGRRVDPDSDRIEVDGVVVNARPGLVYYLLNKPLGAISTAADTHGRTTVVDLVPGEPRVFPVGRLDADTEGLIILTNDGELSQHVTHPSHGIEKTYVAEVRGTPGQQALRSLRRGVELTDGVTAPAKAVLVAPSIVRITIHEGRTRQVRRMCEEVGYPVVRLARVRIGPVADPALPPGQWRLLTNREVRLLSAESPSGAVR